MSALDEFEEKARAAAEWQANYDHYLAHFNNGDPTNMECPGGDACTLPPESEPENSED